MSESIPGVSAVWYTSPVQKAQVVSGLTAALALFPKALALFGIKTPADVAMAVEVIFGLATLGAPIVGGIWRAHSPLQPLTLTKAAAAATPANIAQRAIDVEQAVAQNAPVPPPPPPLEKVV